MNLYSQLLKDLRAELGMSHVDFARNLGVSLSTVIKIERGVSSPSLEIFICAVRMASSHGSEKTFGRFASAVLGTSPQSYAGKRARE